MKRALPVCLLAALCAGCAFGLSAPRATPQPTPSPSPALPLVIALVGGTGETGFVDMVRSIADSAACDFLQLDADKLARWRPAGRAVLVLYLSGDASGAEELDALQSEEVPVYAYAAGGQALPAGLSGLVYDDANAAGMALDEAVEYENHDTPVRLIGLFGTEDSGAAAAWKRAVEDGRVLDKGAYYMDDASKSAGEWLAGRLDGLYAGMLDGLYCESAELARAAAAVVRPSHGDVEIFCAAVDGALLTRMQDAPEPLVRAVGAEPAEAGRLCAEQAIVLLYGGTAQQLSIAPSVFAAS